MSKVYIWQDVAPVTNNWHDGGGVVIVTARDPREVWREHAATTTEDRGDPIETTALDGVEPDVVIPAHGEPDEQVIVFPDAGCC